MVLPPVLDQSYSFGRNELKSNGNDDVGRAEGIEKVVGSALCVGMERKVGKAQRSTCLPVIKLWTAVRWTKVHIP